VCLVAACPDAVVSPGHSLEARVQAMRSETESCTSKTSVRLSSKLPAHISAPSRRPITSTGDANSTGGSLFATCDQQNPPEVPARGDHVAFRLIRFTTVVDGMTASCGC